MREKKGTKKKKVFNKFIFLNELQKLRIVMSSNQMVMHVYSKAHKNSPNI